MNEDPAIKAPIKLLIPLSKIRESKFERQFIMDDEDREKLSKELELTSLDSLKCVYNLHEISKRRIKLKAKLTAKISQISGISLIPISKTINEDFETEFWPIDQYNKLQSNELEIEFGDAIIETYQDEILNIGQVIYEQFVIAIDIFPRGEGETFAWKNEDDEGDAQANPFSILKVLKN